MYILIGEGAKCELTRRHSQPEGAIRSVGAGTGLFSRWAIVQPANVVLSGGKTSSPWQRAMSTPRRTREGLTRSDFGRTAPYWQRGGMATGNVM